MMHITKIAAARLALGMYANEPCRICGRNLDSDELLDAVFAGYSANGKARAARSECWRERQATTWAHQ